MAVYDILPTTDLHYSDIRDTLNANGGSVNNNVASAFKEAANINVWSKKKPVILNSNFPDINSEWWKASDGNCGLEPFKLSSYRNLPDYYENQWNDDMNGWVYKLPQGGELQPLRLGDFRGYNTNAFPPYSNFAIPGKISKKQTEFQTMCIRPLPSENQLVFSDLRTTKECYFGVYIVKDGTSMGERATSNKVDDSTVTFKTASFAVGNYTAYPFLSTEPIGQQDPEVNGTYYSIPQLSPTKFEIIGSFVYIRLIAKAETTPVRRVTYEVSINNSSGGYVYLTNNYIMLRYYDKEWLDPQVFGEIKIKLDNVSVGEGVTVVAEGAFENVRQDLFEHCKVWASFNSSQYLQFVVPLQPMPIP